MLFKINANEFHCLYIVEASTKEEAIKILRTKIKETEYSPLEILEENEIIQITNEDEDYLHCHCNSNE